jgi:integrase
MKRGHYGSGSIDPSGEGSWRLRYRIDGRRHSRVVEGTRTEAAKVLRRLLATADEGRHVPASRVTLGAWIEEWLGLHRASARSLERYAQLLRTNVVPVLGSRPLQSLTPRDIDALYIALRDSRSPRTVRHLHSILGACLKSAVKKGLLPQSPVAGAEAPKAGEPNHGTVLDEAQLVALVDGFRGSPLYGIVAVAAFTGARRNEILALRWSDLDGRQLTIARAIDGRRGLKAPLTDRGTRTIAIDVGLAGLLQGE